MMDYLYVYIAFKDFAKRSIKSCIIQRPLICSICLLKENPSPLSIPPPPIKTIINQKRII